MTTPNTTTAPNHPRAPEGDPAAVTTDHTPSRRCYQRGCPQPACKQADYQYMSRLRLEHHRGQRRRTEATQTRHHIERLLAIGWTQAQITRASGLSPRTIGDIVAGAPTVAKQTALAILSVPIGPPAADTRDVDATGTTRRLRALIAIGWPIAHLASRYGMYPTALGRIACGQMQQVRATTAHRIAVDYGALSEIAGPSQRSRNQAAARSWAPPAAWDDDTIDDPQAHPEWTGHCGTDRGWWIHQRQQLPMCTRCQQAHADWLAKHADLDPMLRNQALFRARAAAVSREADLAADARELLAYGVPVKQAAERLGVTRPHLQQALKRHPDTERAAA